MQVANSNANKDRQVMSMNKSLFYIYRNLRFLLYLKDDKSSSATFSQFVRGFFLMIFFFVYVYVFAETNQLPVLYNDTG